MFKVIYSNLFLPGNFIHINVLCIYHLPAVCLEYIHLYSDTEYSLCVCRSSTVILTMYIQCWHVAHYDYSSHTFEALTMFQSHLVYPGSKWKDASVHQRPPWLSQLFSNKVIQRGGGQGGCSISTGYMHFEICILLCHVSLF